jgi:hypothetical protein
MDCGTASAALITPCLPAKVRSASSICWWRSRSGAAARRPPRTPQPVAVVVRPHRVVRPRPPRWHRRVPVQRIVFTKTALSRAAPSPAAPAAPGRCNGDRARRLRVRASAVNPDRFVSNAPAAPCWWSVSRTAVAPARSAVAACNRVSGPATRPDRSSRESRSAATPARRGHVRDGHHLNFTEQASLS